MFDDQKSQPVTPASPTKDVVDIFDDAELSDIPTNLPVAKKIEETKAVDKTDENKIVIEKKAELVKDLSNPVIQAPENIITPPKDTFKPQSAVNSEIPTSIASKQKTGFLKVIIIVVVIILIFGLSGFLAYRFIMQAPVAVNNITDTSVENTINDKTQQEENPVVEEPVVEIDSDGDGLNDSEEILAGTDINNIDTDKDGLGDREEIKVYGTDPLNADTDDDGYLDGQEVVGGFNPNGPGKLLEIPTK